MMKIGHLLLGMLLVVALAGPSSATEIQCKRILKYLSTGRSVSDVAETMVISEDDVLKCKQEADEAAKAAGEAKPGADAKTGGAAKE
jgi:hypothetical protein